MIFMNILKINDGVFLNSFFRQIIIEIMLPVIPITAKIINNIPIIFFGFILFVSFLLKLYFQNSSENFFLKLKNDINDINILVIYFLLLISSNYRLYLSSLFI